MKKVLLVLVILTIVATSVFALVACGPADPNAFIDAIVKADEFTIYEYDEDGNETVIVSVNKKGEFCIPGSSIYAIKEGDKIAMYEKLSGSDWSKTLISMDSEEYKEFQENVNSYKEEIKSEESLVYVKDDNGFWFLKIDVLKISGVKIEDGKMVMYFKSGDEYIKVGAVSLKADIKLPEEAANAKVVNP